jgi:hypothetical protein
MSIESQAKRIADQLLADLRAKRRTKIDIVDIERAVRGRIDGLAYDRNAIERLIDVTTRRIIDGVG